MKATQIAVLPSVASVPSQFDQPSLGLAGHTRENNYYKVVTAGEMERPSQSHAMGPQE